MINPRLETGLIRTELFSIYDSDELGIREEGFVEIHMVSFFSAHSRA